MREIAYDVVGIGNAIVDVLVHTQDATLEEQGLTKGAMTLIDAEQAAELYARIGPGVECSGGSAANTMVGVASLGGRAAYIGKVREDPLGDTFRRDIREAGVAFDTIAATAGPSTARCLILVTPDAQRTMQTYLGASATLGPDDVDPERIESAAITFLEGYLWDPQPAKEAFLAAARIAHGAGRKVALSLSDSFCVDRHRTEFQDLVQNHVDILFANEEEAVSLFQVEHLDQALERLEGCCDVAAVTRGSHGSVVLAGDRRVEVPAARVERVVDTTGAGDLFASGFLFGLSQGRDPQTCGRLGGIAAGEIISHFGARPEASLRELASDDQAAHQ